MFQSPQKYAFLSKRTNNRQHFVQRDGSFVRKWRDFRTKEPSLCTKLLVAGLGGRHAVVLAEDAGEIGDIEDAALLGNGADECVWRAFL